MELYEVRQTSRRWWQVTCHRCPWSVRHRSHPDASVAGQAHATRRHRRLTQAYVALAA